jgi:hypothetical protein
MRFGVAAAIVVALCAGEAAAQEPLNLSLACEGAASFLVLHSDNNGTIGNVTDDRDSYRRVESRGRVRVRLAAGGGELKLPSTVPGGGDKWLRLTEAEIGPDEIRGRLNFGLMRGASRVIIDRRTGDIELEGSLNFSGSCEKAPDEPEARKF